MSDRKKLVLIGAGSTVFTQRLVADIILSGEIDQWELGLVDIDPVTLDAVDRLVRKMLMLKGVDFPITSTTDRRDVLPGADFVVTTIAVGGRRGWELDVHVPRKHGIFQPVGDTMMPGGISRAMRMIPGASAMRRSRHGSPRCNMRSITAIFSSSCLNLWSAARNHSYRIGPLRRANSTG